MSRDQYPPWPPSNHFAMQQPAQEPQSTIEMSLREHLLAAGAGQTSGPPPVPQQHPHPHQPANIDPQISHPGYSMSPGDTGDGHLSEGRKGRRELSQSKRAAQNRAAQRAFRQRKEEYIKSLKDQVKEFESLSENYKGLQAENYQLRDYIINLQSRLLEMHGDVPPPPANIDLSRPPPHGLPPVSGAVPDQHSPRAHQQAPPSQLQAPTATMTSAAVTQLQQAAAQAAAQHASASPDMKHPIQEEGYLPASSEYPMKRRKSDDVGEQPNGLP